MGKCKQCVCGLICWLGVLTVLAGGLLWWAYQVVDEAELYLPNAPGTAAIVREKDTGIAHIRGDNMESVAYAQGF